MKKLEIVWGVEPEVLRPFAKSWGHDRDFCFSEIGIPGEWEIYKSFDPGLWRKIQVNMIPLRPARRKTTHFQEAREHLEKLEKIYGAEVIMMAVATGDSESRSWEMLPMIKSDLRKTVEELGDEAMLAGLFIRDIGLLEMKRLAVAALNDYEGDIRQEKPIEVSELVGGKVEA